MSIPTLGSPAMLAVQQKVTQLTKQGMPTAQIAQVLQQEVLPTGAVPIAQLYQLLNYVKANSAKAQQGPPDSVAVQLADQVKNIAAHKMLPPGLQALAPQAQQPPPTSQPPQGVNSLPAGPPPQQPSPGVSALPSGPPGMYSGGIVAFDDGGQIDLTPQQQKTAQEQMAIVLKKQQGQQRGAGAVMSDVPQHFDEGGDVSGQGDTVGSAYKDYLTNYFGLDKAVDMYHNLQHAGTTIGQSLGILGKNPVMTPGSGGPQGRFSAMSGQQAPPEAAPTPPPQQQFDFSGLTTLSGSGGGRHAAPFTPGKPPKMPDPEAIDYDKLWSESQAMAKKHGVGKAAEAMNAYLDGEQAKAEKDNKFGKRMALAMAGFQMAAAASQGGATFMGAASQGGLEAARGLMANKQAMDAAEKELAVNRFRVGTAIESQDEDAFKQAVSNHFETDKLRQTAAYQAAEIASRYYTADKQAQWETDRNSELRAARVNSPQNIMGLGYLKAVQEHGKDSPEAQGILGMIGEYNRNSSQYQGTQLRGDNADEAATNKAIASNMTVQIAQMKVARAQQSGDQKAIADAQAQLQQAIQMVRSTINTGGAGGGGGENTGPISLQDWIKSHTGQ